MFKKGIYQHYKGRYYEVLERATHSETLEEVVVYRALYDNFSIWVRPLDMFYEQITIEGRQQSRFEYICDLPGDLFLLKQCQTQPSTINI